MKSLLLGIILLMFGSALFGGAVLSPQGYFDSRQVLALTILIICSFTFGIGLVFFGVGNENFKAKEELIADIKSEGVVVSCAIIERVSRS